MTSLAKDRANIAQFSSVMKRAYQQAKSQNLIPESKVSIYDKLIATPATLQNQKGWVQPSKSHRRWHRRASKMYRRQHGRPAGGFWDDINWEEIWTWIMENIVPLMEMLFMILPFLI